MKSRTLVFTGPGKVDVQINDIGPLQKDQALIAVRAAGICTPELRLFEGRRTTYPWSGGHEVSGQILDTYGDSPITAGSLVSISLAPRCGSCRLCRSGLDNHCAYSTSPGLGPAGFSDLLVADVRQVEQVDTVRPEIAAMVEPLACVLRSISRGIRPSDSVALVNGTGFMSSLHLLVLRSLGIFTVRVRPANASRRPVRIRADEEVTVMSGERLSVAPDLDVDCAFCIPANEAQLGLAINATKRDGTVVLFGAFDDRTNELPLKLVRQRELRLTTSLSHSRSDFAAAASLVPSMASDLERLIGRSLPFDDSLAAFGDVQRYLGLRTYLTPGPAPL